MVAHDRSSITASTAFSDWPSCQAVLDIDVHLGLLTLRFEVPVESTPQFIPKSGVLWHPTEATEEIGRKVLRICADHLAQALTTEFGL
jgi:creatinine amidohydrolase/Fe(II)-dependent formamide hydrolase-like protein